MSRIEHSIEVAVPVREAYDQWTQFEQFPQFMEGVERVDQTDDTHLHWVATVGGKRTEWDAKITEQTPDRRIAWTSVDGDRNSGSVAFERIGEELSRVTLTMDVQPSGVVEKVGDALGVPSGQVEGDLKRFKQFIEARGSATGGWRGEVHQGATTSGAWDTGRELASSGSMASYGSGADLGHDTGRGTPGATAGGATPDDPYGVRAPGSTRLGGAGSTVYGAGTEPDDAAGALDDPLDLPPTRRDGDL